ncbi:peroxisomal assembly protein [Mactra antiquata]
MAASVKFAVKQRVKAVLVNKESGANDHPLHLIISRNSASTLGIPETDNDGYISLWTNTKVVDDSDPATTRTLPPGQGSIFQRMLSNSQNFPEILIPETDDTDVDVSDNATTGMDVEVFVRVVVHDNIWSASSDAYLPDTFNLVCSSQFCGHYNILNKIVYVRLVKLYPINSVTIGVSSHETFQWLTNKGFCGRLLNEVKTQTVLIRSKDVFLSTYGSFLEDPDFKRSFYFDMYVLECSPVQQGRLVPSSELILTYLGDLAAETQHFQNKMESLIVSPKIGGPFKDILMSDFSFAINQNYLSPDPDQDSTEKGPSFKPKAKAMSNSYRKRRPHETIGKFQYEVVPQQPLFRRMLWRNGKNQNFDPLYYVGMSRKLMLKEGLFDSSCVLITPVFPNDDTDEESTCAPVERLCMVRCLGKEYDKSKRLFITPLCLFNMMKKPPIELPMMLILKRYDLTDPDKSTTSRSSWGGIPPIAKEVQISIIPSPNYSPRAPHDEALKHYFSCRRVVALKDVIAIRSSDDPKFWQNTGDDTENRFPCLYFQVVNIKGPKTTHNNVLVDKDATTLIQIGSEHSYVPVMMQTYLNPTPQSFWDKDNLPGLSLHVEKLENFILPHLTCKIGCKSLKSVPPAILVAGPVGSGKTTLIVAVARKLGVHAFKVNCHTLYGETSASTESKMKNAFNAAGLYSPCILLLQSIHALGRDRDGNTEDPRVASSFLNNVMQLKNDLQLYPMIVVATTHSDKDLTCDMLECFLHQVNIEVPTELERGEIVDSMLQTVNHSGNVNIPYIAQRTAGFVLGDLAALVAHAKREAFRRMIKMCCNGELRPTLQEEDDLTAAGIVLQQADFQTALDELQAAHSDAIGAPKIPNVTWDDVGGLMDVKKEILDTIQLPLQYPELLAAGLRRSGVLLYGPPGTGKTLLAKAVATECSLNFLSVKGPELINMYVGQSEQNVREVFHRARSASPCVIFFDELDSLAPNRGKSGDSGGVMDRVVSQLLAELDGLNKASDVFVIGATNRPDLLDPALLRPGRFDKLLYLGISDDNSSQYRILTALTRKFNMAEDFDLESFVEKCPFNLTGADFYALASDAMLNALKRKIKSLEDGKTTDQSIIVEGEDFDCALKNLTPSVTEGELLRYIHLRNQFNVDKSNSMPV